MKFVAFLLFVVGGFGVGAEGASAHAASRSVLLLDAREDVTTGRVDLPLRELAALFDLDIDHNGDITWGELKAANAAIGRYLETHVVIRKNDAACALSLAAPAVDRRDEVYGVWPLAAACPPGPVTTLTVHLDLLLETDPRHTGVLRLETAAGQTPFLFSTTARDFRYEPQTARSAFASFLHEGSLHISSGYDHMLFLLGLIVPSVYRRRSGRLETREGFREVAKVAAKLVTSFTVAHSLSLALVTLAIVPAISPKLVESAIALTIFCVGLNNVTGFLRSREAIMCLAFGLIHGLGFASGLAELGVSGANVGIALTAYNVGIELANLLVVALALPLAYAVRALVFGRRVLVYGSAVTMCTLALGWLGQAVSGVEFMPF